MAKLSSRLMAASHANLVIISVIAPPQVTTKRRNGALKLLHFVRRCPVDRTVDGPNTRGLETPAGPATHDTWYSLSLVREKPGGWESGTPG
ncbi:hypothetical protein SARC_06490 [Sphaeroforma arctica JP610]|uniref:Uncharacterized protein n=1 Tax=Sphaeroforma arctica JP610 TaxID=667725 RepID=A0A0L0FX19_9EUKA|nr:hypothetical protein SARC_06490 [Sphaeroforma arctica JP610]KNC81179.1 hypothetical protein SARC_06490 [Sphaeroforma arctica JP610]|eukprot:XP_014155081.1 hypothetical protein SARC_06490 [Sphaeroforma arctica JP610]